MCRYASVYWIFLFTSFKCADWFKVLVYFKTIQPKVQTWWSGKFEAGATTLSQKEREKRLFWRWDQSEGPTPEATEGDPVWEEGGGKGPVEQGDR